MTRNWRKSSTGVPAITDSRHAQFLSQLDYFREQLKDPHVTRYMLREKYIKANPEGYTVKTLIQYLDDL